MKTGLRVVFMGTPEFAVPSLEYLVLNQYQVVAVYTQPDREAGRGRAMVASPVKKAALECGLPVLQPVKLRDPQTVAQLANLHPDIVIVAAFGQILPQPVLDIPAYHCINIHPSLLPRHRGASPVAATILSGDEFAGVSIMLMDKGLDTGPVLAQSQVPVPRWDTTGSLTEKLSVVSAYMLVDVLPSWVAGEIVPRPQDNSMATYSAEFSRKDAEIDWQLPAVDLWRRVRALNPWPGSFTRWQGKQLKIIESEPVPAEKTSAGEVIATDEKGTSFGVGTGTGILKILRLQLEGKQAMSAAEFLRGQRNFIGATLPSE